MILQEIWWNLIQFKLKSLMYYIERVIFRCIFSNVLCFFYSNNQPIRFSDNSSGKLIDFLI